MANSMNTQFEQTAAGLLQALGVFDDEQVNSIPFAASWTPGQVGEHILISASGVLQALNGPAKPADRDPQLQVAPLQNLFLNFGIKMQGPDFVQPSTAPKDRAQLLASLKKTMESLMEFAQTQENLTLVCTAFEMPQFGYLTRLELLWFFIVHAQRHIHQLQKMALYFPLLTK